MDVVVAGVAMAWLLINWVTTPTAAWLVAVALLASGVFGVALRWSAVRWFAVPRSPAGEVGHQANLAVCTLIIAVLYIWARHTIPSAGCRSLARTPSIKLRLRNRRKQ